MVEAGPTFVPVTRDINTSREQTSLPDRMKQMLPGYVDRAFANFTESPTDISAFLEIQRAMSVFGLLPIGERAKYIDKCFDFSIPPSTRGTDMDLQNILITHIRSIQTAAVKKIGILPPELRVKYIEKALEMDHVDIYRAAVEQIHTLPKRQRINYMKRFTRETGNSEGIRRVAILQLDSIREGRRPRFFFRCLGKEKDTSFLNEETARQFHLLPDRKKAKTARKILGRNNKLSEIIASQLHSIEQRTKRDQLIRICIANENPKIRSEAIKQLGYLSDPKERVRHVGEYIKANYPDDIRIAAIGQLRNVPEGDREDIFVTCINDPNIAIQKAAIAQLGSLPQQPEDLRDKHVDALLSHTNYEIIYATIEQLGVLSQDRSEHYIRQCILMGGGFMQKAIGQLGILSPEQRQGLIRDFPQVQELINKLSPLVEENPLYRKISPGERFVRKPYERFDVSPRSQAAGDRSTITLLDMVDDNQDPRTAASLIGKVIMRTMPLSSYCAWEKAVNAPPGFWQSLGFNSPPIEPIIEANPNADDISSVDVYAGVLPGVSYDIWRQGTSYSGYESLRLDPFEVEEVGAREGSTLYKKEIEDMISRIKIGLKKLGVNHEELVPSSFMIVFGKTSDREPDFTHEPQVHVVDFGLAFISDSISS